MKYEDIKKIVVASICIGFFLIIVQIVNIVLIYKNKGEGDYANTWNSASPFVFGIILTIVLLIIVPVLYLRHLNKIAREKAVDIPKIQKKEILEVGYCQTCGAKILDNVGDFCSKCGAKIK